MPRTPISIRRARLADLDALVALEEKTFTSDRISRRQWRRQIASASVTVLVAATAGRVDAAAVVFYRRHSRHARVYSLAVDARARGTGAGSALLAAVEADARARGCTAMQLEVHVGNSIAITLYEHRGYRRGTRMPAFYEDGGDAWRYVKALVHAA